MTLPLEANPAHQKRIATRRCRLQLERLENRILLAGLVEWAHLSTEFGDLETPNSGGVQNASLVFDVNNDNINDFVIAERSRAPSVVWYRRDPDGWTKHKIDDNVLPIEAGGAFHDIDGDGDQDIVLGENGGRDMWWWENPFPNHDPDDPWTRRRIKETPFNGHHDQAFGDVDGDGQTELIAWNTSVNELMLIEIPADPRNHVGEWSRTVIATVGGQDKAEGLAIADIDLDGKDDIVGAGEWFKHISGTTFQSFTIDGRNSTRSAVGQLIPGGRPEVVIVPGDADGALRWYEWDAVQATWDDHQLIGNVKRGHSLGIGDVNQDGHLDIFNAGMRGEKAIMFYGDSTGNFIQQVVSDGIGHHESRLADLDGDGDLDILGKPHRRHTPRLDVFLNDGIIEGSDAWNRHELDSDLPWRTIFVDTGDLNGDNQVDVITGGWWYDNPGEVNEPWSRNTLGSPLNNMAAVFDFDRDGHLDVLGTSGMHFSSNFVWAHNDGSGNFTIYDKIQSGSGDFLQGVAVDRFGPNRTGPLEIALSWHGGGGGIEMLTVTDDPFNDRWPLRNISSTSQHEAISSGDIDNDGDNDLLLGTKWLRNDQDSWTTFTLHNTNKSPDRNRLVDMNGDGLLDAVVGYEAISSPGKLAWYQQPATGPENAWIEHEIATIIGPMSVSVEDLDDDGDMDVVAGEHNKANLEKSQAFVFENMDGTGTEWTEHLVYKGDEHHDGTELVDIDADGDWDIVSIGWNNDKLVLYESVSNSIGPVSDSNTDPNIVAENSVEGTTVGITAFAEDAVDYVLTDDAGGRFAIDSLSGIVTTTAIPLDAETEMNRTITVQANLSDATSVEGVFNVRVTDVNEYPPEIIPGQAFSVFEQTPNGEGLGFVFADDDDVTKIFGNWTVTQCSQDCPFAVDNNSGHLTLVDQTQLDAEAMPSYALSITVDDADHPPAEGIITIGVIPGALPTILTVDQSANEVFKYDENGILLDNYSVDADFGKPRGMAANADGTITWLVDHKGVVQLRDGAGLVLGSWQAEGLRSPDGMATDGTHIWIVDRIRNRVYFFEDGASRTSGSAPESSSFKLVQGNRNPRGITTDGACIWVVNDGGNDSVFKYSLDGTLLGSWTIDSDNNSPHGKNKSPRGIAVNPNNPTDILIVDRGSDKIFQYTGAASRIAGNQEADAGFDLDADNRSPEGIANYGGVAGVEANLHSKRLTSPLVLGRFFAERNQPSNILTIDCR